MARCLVRASQIAQFLQSELEGADIDVWWPSTLDAPTDNTFVFANAITPEAEGKIKNRPGTLILRPKEGVDLGSTPQIRVGAPRYAFGIVMARFFAPQRTPGIAPTAIVPAGVRIGEHVSIGHYTVIGEGVEIGDDTVILNHVVIASNVRIGRRCYIKSHAVIGEEGFGFARDPQGLWRRIPHVGGVEISDDVEVGSLTTVVQGTLEPTVLAANVKLDDHVHVSHNNKVGTNTLMMAGAVICGSVHIGEECWIGPQSSMMDKITIANKAFIGLGAVVDRPVAAGITLGAMPARIIPKLG